MSSVDTFIYIRTFLICNGNNCAFKSFLINPFSFRYYHWLVRCRILISLSAILLRCPIQRSRCCCLHLFYWIFGSYAVIFLVALRVLICLGMRIITVNNSIVYVTLFPLKYCYLSIRSHSDNSESSSCHSCALSCACVVLGGRDESSSLI